MIFKIPNYQNYMQLHTLRQVHANKSHRTRVGRGGKRGTTSGRGTKGQRSRSGHRIRPAERDYIQRLPKLRGYKNHPLVASHVFRLNQLIGFNLSGEITPRSLSQAGIVNFRKGTEIKIIGGGIVSKPLKLKGIAVSKSVREAIIKAGGTIIESREQTTSDVVRNRKA